MESRLIPVPNFMIIRAITTIESYDGEGGGGGGDSLLTHEHHRHVILLIIIFLTERTK